MRIKIILERIIINQKQRYLKQDTSYEQIKSIGKTDREKHVKYPVLDQKLNKQRHLDQNISCEL